MPQIETPECDRLCAVSDESQAIGNFLDWLFEQGVYLCYRTSEPWADGVEWAPHHESITNLLARYFDIDMKKVEGERRAILAELRGES